MYALESWPFVSLPAPFPTAESGSLSKGPGEPWKLGSGVAEPERVVRSMLVVVVVGMGAGLGWCAALFPELELAGRSTGQ